MSRRDADAFREDTAALIGAAAAARDRFGIAVSGGPDSLALLCLAHAAFPGRVAAASVDHRLRAEAAAECAHVAAICEAMGVPHSILSPAHPPTATQAAARDVRYALLEAWRAASGLDWLMTGHHADDQLETMVMRLNRSSGVGGLAGVRARNGVILRPLLGWLRADLGVIVAEAGLTPVDDPANRDPRHDRSRIRDALARQTLLDPVAVAASARHLAEADAALQWMTDQLLGTHVERTGGSITLRLDSWPPEILRRLLLAILTSRDKAAPRGAELDHLAAALAAGKPASLAGWIASPVAGAPERWLFRPEERRTG